MGSTLSSEVKRFALLNFIRNAKNPENTFTHVFYQERRRFRLGHSVRSSKKNLSSTTNSRPLLLASVHRIKVGGDNFDRLKNTPALKATIRGPFHREMGLDASIDPKASIREKNRLIYHTSI